MYESADGVIYHYTCHVLHNLKLHVMFYNSMIVIDIVKMTKYMFLGHVGQLYCWLFMLHFYCSVTHFWSYFLLMYLKAHLPVCLAVKWHHLAVFTPC